jgi:hypothetical protein
MEKRLIMALGLLTAALLGVVAFSLLTLDFRYLAGSEDYSLPVGEPGILLAGAAAFLIIVAMALAFDGRQKKIATPRPVGGQGQRPSAATPEYGLGNDIPAAA